MSHMPPLYTRKTQQKLALRQILGASAAVIIMAALATGTAIAEPKPYLGNGQHASQNMGQNTPQNASVSGGSGMNVHTQTANVRTQVLNLPKGRSAVVDLPVDASDVFVSNPTVADAVLRTPRRIFVLGVANGQSDAIFFDGMGRQILNLSIRVDTPVDGLSDTIRQIFPTSNVEVQSVNGHVVLSGMVQNNSEASQVARLAESFAGGPDNVLNLISITGKDQVTLKVRIVEVNRSMIKQLGMASDITYNNGTRSYSFGTGGQFSTNGKFQGGKGLCYGQNGTTTLNGTNTVTTTTPTPTGSVESVVTNEGVSKFGTTSSACLQAFERVGLARTLAEPNLTAVSGESAKFLAGGEFPVPSGQDNQGRVSVEFKPFGVGLGFTPVVLSGGRISMHISTEVSELSNVGALQITGLTIPGLTVRRAESSVEMQSGSSLMMAGLLQSKYRQSIDSLPGLTSLPVLGALFRSRDFLNDETELVILVTPYIVDPAHPGDMQTPADNLQPASDMNAVFMGNLNRVIAQKAGSTSTQASAPSTPYQAPIGYVIE